MNGRREIDVTRISASEWRASLVDGGEVRFTASAHTCPDAISALHCRIEREGEEPPPVTPG